MSGFGHGQPFSSQELSLLTDNTKAPVKHLRSWLLPETRKNLEKTKDGAGVKEASRTLCMSVLCVYWKPNTGLTTNWQEPCNSHAT